MNDELIFEGEYLYGKIWSGKGKEYDNHGNLIFEGEYINSLKNGTIKEFSTIFDIYLISEEKYINGLKNGLVKH